MHGRWTQKILTYTKTSMIRYELIHRTWNSSVELREGGKGKENDRASTISQNITSVEVEDVRMSIESCKK
jgi:hypothetical protein